MVGSSAVGRCAGRGGGVEENIDSGKPTMLVGKRPRKNQVISYVRFVFLLQTTLAFRMHLPGIKGSLVVPLYPCGRMPAGFPQHGPRPDTALTWTHMGYSQNSLKGGYIGD